MKNMQTARCKTYGLLICTLLIIVQILISCQTDHRTFHPVLLRAERLMSERPDSALLLLEDSIVASRLSGKNYADWCLLLTQARDKEYVVHTSDSLIRGALEYYEDGKDPERLMLTWYYMGRVSQDLNDAIRAQEYYLKALDAGKLSDDIALKARVCNNLGMLYNYQSAPDIALSYLKEGLEYLRQMGDTLSQSFVLRDIGRTYELTDSLDTSLSYYDNALIYANKNSYASILCELGGIYLKKDEYPKALNCLQEALISIESPSSYHPVCLTLGEVFLKTGQLDSARYYLRISMQSTELNTKAASYYHLYHLEESIQNWKEYAFLQSQYERLRDSLQQQTYTETFQRMQSLYDYSQVKNEAQQYQLNHAISQRNFYLTLLMCFMLCVGMTGYFLYMRNRKRQWDIQKRQLNELNENLQKESKEQIQINLTKISLLEEELVNNARERERSLIESDKRSLEYENLRIEQDLESKKMRESAFINSDIYKKLHENKPWEADEKDRKALMDAVNVAYPDFEGHLIKLAPAGINPVSKFILYLIKANLNPGFISWRTGLTLQAVYNRRRFLCKKMLGESFVFSEFDNYVRSL